MGWPSPLMSMNWTFYAQAAAMLRLEIKPWQWASKTMLEHHAGIEGGGARGVVLEARFQRLQIKFLVHKEVECKGKSCPVRFAPTAAPATSVRGNH